MVSNHVQCFTGLAKAEGFGFKGNKYKSGITPVLSLARSIVFNERFKSTWTYSKSSQAEVYASMINMF